MKFITFICLTTLTSISFAASSSLGSGYPNPPYYNGNVYNNASGGYVTRERISVHVNTPNFVGNGNYDYPPRHYHRGMGPEWINMQQGMRLPQEAVLSGSENGYPLYVCRANYNGAEHPGKLTANGTCNISFGGREISTNVYQVLISHRPLRWIGGSYGFIPARAVVGGMEMGRILYICQTNYRGSEQTGKIVDTNCNIPYEGREIALAYYNVLAV